jgi:predicted alpha/beta superfamily hydrolase
MLIMFVMVISLVPQANATVINESIDSKVFKQQRALTISLPKNYERNKHASYPVMYLLDGPTNIAHTSGSLDYLNAMGMAPEVIIVGIVNINRTYDLTPTQTSDNPENTGGGVQMLDFIQSELMPFIASKYRTVDYNIFTGHSFGGLLVVHALATRADLFDAYFAYSPSLWFDNEKTLKLATKAFAAKPKLKSYLYVNLADEKGKMLSAFDKFEQLLNNHAPKTLRFKLERFEQETHGSIPLIGQIKAYRDLYVNWQMPREMYDKGVDAIEEFFAQKSKDFGYQILPSENGLVGMGYYQLFQQKSADEAVKLFELGVKNYPHSSNVYDSLAEGYQGQGKLDEALKAVNKALSVGGKQDPNYQAYLEHHKAILTLLEERGKSSL